MSSVIFVIGVTQPSLQFSIVKIATKHKFVIQRKKIQWVGFWLLKLFAAAYYLIAHNN